MPRIALCSRIDSAASRSFTFDKSRPQDPTAGFSTAGYPMSSIASSAETSVNAIRSAGCGMSWSFSASDVRILSPQTVATSAVLTQRTSALSNSRNPCIAREWLMQRSSTTSTPGARCRSKMRRRSSSITTSASGCRFSSSSSSFSSFRISE